MISCSVGFPSACSLLLGASIGAKVLLTKLDCVWGNQQNITIINLMRFEK